MKKKNLSDLDTITIEVKFKDGTVVKATNPATLLMSYQNFDMEDIGKKFEETGKYGLKDSKDDIGGLQVMGSAENIKFSLFTLLRQLVDTIGSKDVIDVFNRMMMYIADQHRIEMQMEEAARDKSKPRN